MSCYAAPTVKSRLSLVKARLLVEEVLSVVVGLEELAIRLAMEGTLGDVLTAYQGSI